MWVFLVCGVVIPQTPHVVLVLILAPLTDTTYVVCVCARVCYSHLTDTQRGARARASTAHRISVMMGVCVCSCVYYYHPADTQRDACTHASMSYRNILCVMMCAFFLVCVVGWLRLVGSLKL